MNELGIEENEGDNYSFQNVSIDEDLNKCTYDRKEDRHTYIVKGGIVSITT